MAVAISIKACSTSAVTTLATAGAAHTDVVVRCAAGTIYLGGATVCSTGGLTLTTAATSAAPYSGLPQLWPGDILYGIGSSSGISVEVFTRYSTQAG